MFSVGFNRGRKRASSSYGERKPPAQTATVHCCNVQMGRRSQPGWRRGAGGCVGSGALLVLLPKCPLCIAAYLTLWTGASAAVSIATHLRPMLSILFSASALLLVVRRRVARTLDADRLRNG